MQFERNTYQTGSLGRVARKKGPAVWEWRYRNHSEPESPLRQMTLSTVEYPTEAKARVALHPLNGTASFKQNNVVTVGNLIDRFAQDERLDDILSQLPGATRLQAVFSTARP